MKKIKKQQIKNLRLGLGVLGVSVGAAIVITVPLTLQAGFMKKEREMQNQIDASKNYLDSIFSSNNNYLGSFSTPAKKLEFLSAKEILKEQFKGEAGLVYLDMSDITSLDYGAFKNASNLNL